MAAALENPRITPSPALRAALIALLTLVAYAGALKAEFVYDDHTGVAQNPVVTGEVPFNEVLSRDFWGLRPSEIRTYRPVSVAVETLEWRASQGSSAFMHGVSVVMHTVLMVALYLVWRRIVGEDVAWGGALLVSVLAAPSEVVLTIVGQSDILSGLFVTLGLAAHRRPGGQWIALAAACFGLALGCKESALVAPVAWLWLDVTFPVEEKRRAWPVRLGAYAAAAAAVLVVRQLALGNVVPSVSDLNNPLKGASLLARWLGAGRVFLTKYWASVVDPSNWQYDCSFAACRPGSTTDAVAWVGLLLALAFVIVPLLVYRRAPTLAAGMGWLVLFFAPTSNFFILAGAIYGSRWFYQPLLAFGFVVAAGLNTLSARLHRPWLSWGLCSALVLANAAALQNRVVDWRTPLNLFRSGLEQAEESAVVQRNLAEAYVNAGDAEAALPHARKALEIAPDFSFAHETLAVALDMAGQPGAETEFQSALRYGAGKSTYASYATFLARHGRLEQALAAAREGLQRPGANPTKLVKLGQQLAQDVASKQ